MTDPENREPANPEAPIPGHELSRERLYALFGPETVNLASQVDAADLNLTDAMAGTIAKGVRKLKELRGDPAAQRRLVKELAPGSRLLLCLWIMDMDLVDRIQDPRASI